MGKYFGTDGFRGKFGKTLTLEHAKKVGQFLGFYYGSKDVAGIVIGMDTRESSPFLKTAITQGANSYGVDVYDLEVITTPGVAYLAKKYGMPGVVLSASHNPYYDNGIKLFNEKGEKMDQCVLDALEIFMDEREVPTREKESGRVISFTEGKEAYINLLVSKASDYTGLNVAIDTSNGAASSIAPLIFKRLKGNFEFINFTPDGKNINNDCGSTCMEAISKHVKEGNYNIGFAYDGDADRCLFTDEAGNILDGDHLLYLVGKYLHDKGKLKNDTVVATLMSNVGLDKALEKENIKVARVQVGDKNVYAYQIQNDCNFGGEQSGHFIFLDDLSTGDGILTSIKILNILVETKRKVSELVSGITIFPQILKNVLVNDKENVLNDVEINRVIEEQEAKLKGVGRVFIRPSGTEPKIRVMAEASTIELAKEIVDTIVNAIESSKYKAE